MSSVTRFISLSLAATALAGGNLAAAPAGGPPDRAPVRFARVRLDTGISVRYAEAGDPAAAPIIFLHGYSDSWYSFSPIMPLLGTRYRLIAPDFRGHGESDKPAAGYGMRDLAADVLALMDELEIRQATIVGHSMGSFVAQQLALAAPGRVTRLVLVGSATGVRGMNEPAAFEAAVDSLEDPVSIDFIRGFQESTIHHPVPPAFLDSVVGESRQLTAAVWKSLLAGMIATPPAAGLAETRIPTLLVWGDFDAVFAKAERDRLAAALPAAERLDYADTGHATHWERPARFVADLEEFIRRTPAKGGAR